MESKQCNVCNKEMHLVPAGVSKATGRPYNEFWACPDKCRQLKENEIVILVELKKINKRLDDMGYFLTQKLK